MNRGNIKLKCAERFTDGYQIPKEKLQKALDAALKKLRDKAPEYMDGFPQGRADNHRYTLGTNNNWIHGMHTGSYILAYEASGDEFFLDVAKHHLKSYEQKLIDDIDMDTHDVGFSYSPSCVAYYKLTGDEYAKELSLKAADVLYDRCYTEDGGFILRSRAGKELKDKTGMGACRTMMDTMMNAPLFFWKGTVTGDERFTKAALSQCRVTADYLIRADGSSYHHYQFEPGSFKPLHGLTFQGNRDESTWTRGHSWGIIGYPIAYSYSPCDYMLPVHRDVTYYFLNNLPQDLIPYWDFDFISGDEPRDTSAAAISVCGMLSAIQTLPYGEEEKGILSAAANKIIDSIIDKYTTETGEEYDGLLTGVTAARRITGNNYAVESCALYGDYFYLEALVRLYRPDWKKYW